MIEVVKAWGVLTGGHLDGEAYRHRLNASHIASVMNAQVGNRATASVEQIVELLEVDWRAIDSLLQDLASINGDRLAMCVNCCQDLRARAMAIRTGVPRRMGTISRTDLRATPLVGVIESAPQIVAEMELPAPAAPADGVA
jgi:hypothetical protein